MLVWRGWEQKGARVWGGEATLRRWEAEGEGLYTFNGMEAYHDRTPESRKKSRSKNPDKLSAFLHGCRIFFHKKSGQMGPMARSRLGTTVIILLMRWVFPWALVWGQRCCPHHLERAGTYCVFCDCWLSASSWTVGEKPSARKPMANSKMRTETQLPVADAGQIFILRKGESGHDSPVQGFGLQAQCQGSYHDWQRENKRGICINSISPPDWPSVARWDREFPVTSPVSARTVRNSVLANAPHWICQRRIIFLS